MEGTFFGRGGDGEQAHLGLARQHLDMHQGRDLLNQPAAEDARDVREGRLTGLVFAGDASVPSQVGSDSQQDQGDIAGDPNSHLKTLTRRERSQDRCPKRCLHRFSSLVDRSTADSPELGQFARKQAIRWFAYQLRFAPVSFRSSNGVFHCKRQWPGKIPGLILHIQ